MPKIPFFRDWYEKKFGDLCYVHDEQYKTIKTKNDKHEVDYQFCASIAKRGYFILSVLTLLAVNLPWVGRKVK